MGRRRVPSTSKKTLPRDSWFWVPLKLRLISEPFKFVADWWSHYTAFSEGFIKRNWCIENAWGRYECEKRVEKRGISARDSADGGWFVRCAEYLRSACVFSGVLRTWWLRELPGLAKRVAFLGRGWWLPLCAIGLMAAKRQVWRMSAMEKCASAAAFHWFWHSMYFLETSSGGSGRFQLLF